MTRWRITSDTLDTLDKMAKISSLFDDVMQKTIDSLDDKIDCFIKLYVGTFA